MPRPLYTLMVIMVIAAGLAGCSPLGVLNATVSSDGYQLTENQPYGKAARQTLNVYVPNDLDDNSAANRDVVIFYYGGRWQFGEKDQYAFVADAFTSKGYVTVLPDYRLYPSADWRDFINDGASAYQWVYENIARFHGNPQRIFIAGHSAGAHIAAMVDTNEALLPNRIKRPCGFIGLAGPYDFLPISDADVQLVFSSANDLRDTQPITYVSQGDPVMLLLHGKDDTTVKPGNTTRLAKRANQFGHNAETILYNDVDHIDILLSLSSTFRGFSPALDDSVAFMKKVQCPG